MIHIVQIRELSRTIGLQIVQANAYLGERCKGVHFREMTQPHGAISGQVGFRSLPESPQVADYLPLACHGPGRERFEILAEIATKLYDRRATE